MLCPDPKSYILPLVLSVMGIISMVLECYLGKTEKIKAGSILELIWNIIIKIISRIKK